MEMPHQTPLGTRGPRLVRNPIQPGTGQSPGLEPAVGVRKASLRPGRQVLSEAARQAPEQTRRHSTPAEPSPKPIGEVFGDNSVTVQHVGGAAAYGEGDRVGVHLVEDVAEKVGRQIVAVALHEPDAPPGSP